MLPATARRLVALCALAVCVAAGLGVHVFATGVFGDITGDALYAVAVYAALVIALPRSRVSPAAIAAAWCTGVELLQLTGAPLALAAMFPPAALVLGTGFDARDLVVYLLAIAVTWVIDRAVSRRIRPLDLHRSRRAPSMGE